MATLTITPTLTGLRKNSDGSYDFLARFFDASGNSRGLCEVHVNADGTTYSNGVATGTNLTAAQMTTLNNNWNTYQNFINTLDTNGKISPN